MAAEWNLKDVSMILPARLGDGKYEGRATSIFGTAPPSLRIPILPP